MCFVDAEAVGKIEKFCALDDKNYILSLKNHFSDAAGEADFFEFEEGVACFGGQSPFTSCHGLFSNEDWHNELFNQVEGFYKKHNSPINLYLPSVSEPRAFSELKLRNFFPQFFKNIFILNLSSRPQNLSFKRNSILEVKNEEDLGLWKKLVSAGFFSRNDLSDVDIISLGQSLKINSQNFILFYKNDPAAAASLYWDERFVRLGGMSVLPKFRGLGLQRELIQHRLEYARGLGKKLAISDTLPGTKSQKNLESCGFKLAYTRLLMSRPA